MKKAKPYLSRQLLINIYYNRKTSLWLLQHCVGQYWYDASRSTPKVAKSCSSYHYWSPIQNRSHMRCFFCFGLVKSGTQPQSSESYNDAQNYEWKLSFIFIYRNVWEAVWLNNNLNVQIPNVRTECYKKSFAVSASFLWNSLPNDLKEEKSLSKFKTQIKKHNYFCIDNL